MAQPEQAQPSDEQPERNAHPELGSSGLAQYPPTPPDQVIVSAFNLQVQTGPAGERLLMLYHINRREVLMLDLNNEAAAEKLAQEIKPSRVVAPHTNGNGGAVLL
jgi:hypothetical protein